MATSTVQSYEHTNRFGSASVSTHPALFGYLMKGTDTLTVERQEEWVTTRCIGKVLSMLIGPRGESIEENVLDCLSFLAKAEQWPTGHRQVAAEEIERLYLLHNAPAVWGFLERFPAVAEALLGAYPYLRKYFGPEPRVALEVVSDPEAEGEQDLFAYILTEISVDEALSRLDGFDEEWFLDQIRRTAGRFSFALAYI